MALATQKLVEITKYQHGNQNCKATWFELNTVSLLDSTDSAHLV